MKFRCLSLYSESKGLNSGTSIRRCCRYNRIPCRQFSRWWQRFRSRGTSTRVSAQRSKPSVNGSSSHFVWSTKHLRTRIGVRNEPRDSRSFLVESAIAFVKRKMSDNKSTVGIFECNSISKYENSRNPNLPLRTLLSYLLPFVALNMRCASFPDCTKLWGSQIPNKSFFHVRNTRFSNVQPYFVEYAGTARFSPTFFSPKSLVFDVSFYQKDKKTKRNLGLEGLSREIELITRLRRINVPLAKMKIHLIVLRHISCYRQEVKLLICALNNYYNFITFV